MENNGDVSIIAVTSGYIIMFFLFKQIQVLRRLFIVRPVFPDAGIRQMYMNGIFIVGRGNKLNTV